MTELLPFMNRFQLKALNKRPIKVIIAAYNEEEGIVPTIIEFKEALNGAHIIVVDGNSSDKTIELSEKLGAEVLIQEGKGKGNAIAKGISNLTDDTSYVIFSDADYTYPAKSLMKMIDLLDSHPSVGMVLGNRFSKVYKHESDRNQFYLGNKILALVHNLFFGLKLKDPFTGLRVIRYKLLKGWIPKSNGFDIEAEINCHVNRMGYRIVEVPIKYRRRLGEKKLGFRHGFEILKRIIYA